MTRPGLSVIKRRFPLPLRGLPDHRGERRGRSPSSPYRLPPRIFCASAREKRVPIAMA